MSRAARDLPSGSGSFPTTQWGDILTIGRRPDAGFRHRLDQFIRRYWKPVYYFICRSYTDREWAKDLTQEFFATIMEKDGRLLRAVDPRRSRFRAYLAACLQNFLIDKNRARVAKKRRPAEGIVSLDQLRTFDNQLEPSHDETPEKGLIRTWAACVVENALERLEAQCAVDGHSVHFQIFRDLYLPCAGARPTTDELARRHGLKDGKQASNHAETVKRRFKKVFREEIRMTVSDDQSFAEELRDLWSALAMR